MDLSGLQKLSSRDKALLAVCFATVSLAVCNWAVIRPIRTRFTEVNAEIGSSTDQLRRYRRIVARKDQLEKEYAAIRKYVKEQAATGQPEDKPDAAITTELGNFAAECGINVLEVQSRGSEKGMFVEEHAVQVVVEGDRVNLMRFLYKIEDSPQLLRVAKIDMAPSSRKKNTLIKSTVLVTMLLSVGN